MYCLKINADKIAKKCNHLEQPYTNYDSIIIITNYISFQLINDQNDITFLIPSNTIV